MNRKVFIALALVAILAMAVPAGAQADATADTPDETAESRTSVAESDGFVLVFPVLSEETRFSDSFGNARSAGRSHKGNDLLAERGTPIAAAADGRVARMTYGARAGYYMVIDHGNGYSTWYMHLNNDSEGTDDGLGGAEAAFATELEVGDPVAAGQVVAYVGDSGNAERTTPHLHFELRVFNTALDPYVDLVDSFERYLLENEIEEGDTPFK